MANAIQNFNNKFNGFVLFNDAQGKTISLPGDVINKLIDYLKDNQKGFVSLAMTCKRNWEILSASDEYFNLKIPRTILFPKNAFMNETGKGKYLKLTANLFENQPTVTVYPHRFNKEWKFCISKDQIHSFDGRYYQVHDLEGKLKFLGEELFSSHIDADGAFTLLTDDLILVTTGYRQSYIYKSSSMEMFRLSGPFVGFHQANGVEVIAVHQGDQVVDLFTGNIIAADNRIGTCFVGHHCLFKGKDVWAFTNGILKGPVTLKISSEDDLILRCAFHSDKFVVYLDKTHSILCFDMSGNLLASLVLTPEDSNFHKFHLQGNEIFLIKNRYDGSNPIARYSLKTGQRLEMNLNLHGKVSALAKWTVDTYDNARRKPVIRDITSKLYDTFKISMPLPLPFSNFKCLGISDGKIAIAENVESLFGFNYQIVKIYDFDGSSS